MQFSHIINAALTHEPDRPLMQKDVYPVSDALQQYLQQYQRDIVLPVSYNELLHYRYTNAIRDKNGNHTHWENVLYDADQQARLEQQLHQTYRLLVKPVDSNFAVTAIDFCEYANSMPFRVTITNNANGEQCLFYIKAADSSRIYGLELEHLLSPDSIHFLYHQNTLIEQHINGMPGDDFLPSVSQLPSTATQQLAEEFIRFNERSFARLLGDMRSYNFVIQERSDAGKPFHIRAIDFDQQCYEGRLNLYLPQFYKENIEYVKLAFQFFSNETIEKLRLEERQNMAENATGNQHRLRTLLQTMAKEELSDNYKVLSLKNELNGYFSTDAFAHCNSMGQILQQQLQQVLGWK